MRHAGALNDLRGFDPGTSRWTLLASGVFRLSPSPPLALSPSKGPSILSLSKDLSPSKGPSILSLSKGWCPRHRGFEKLSPNG